MDSETFILIRGYSVPAGVVFRYGRHWWKKAQHNTVLGVALKDGKTTVCLPIHTVVAMRKKDLPARCNQLIISEGEILKNSHLTNPVICDIV